MDRLLEVGRESVNIPDNISLHPQLTKTLVQARLKKLNDGEIIDWATAESLAIGTLLQDGRYLILKKRCSGYV